MRSLLKDLDIEGVDLVGSPANRRPFALLKATWNTAYINSLPDSSFAYVEPGAGDDKSKRHLPYKDASGKVDLPHLRDALARLDQTQIPDAAKAAARKKLEAAARTAGVGDHEQKSALRAEEPMKLTLAEFRKRLADEIEGDVSDQKLASLAKALKIEIVKEAIADDGHGADPEPTDTQKSAFRKFLEAFGLATPAEPSPLDKSKLDPETRTYVTSLEKRLAAIETTAATERKTALQKRATALQEHGWIEQGEDFATITEPEVAALEKARDRITERLKKAGVLESFGSVKKADDEPASVRALVYKAVVDHLGREPLSKMEEVRIRKAIYDANPGLAAAARAEEAAEKKQRTGS